MTGAASIERFQKDGFAILEQVFEPEFIDSLWDEYRLQYPDIAQAPDRYSVGERRIQVSMQLKGPFLSPDLYANDEVLALTRAALGEDFLIDNFSLVAALPGATDQQLHRDHLDLIPEYSFSRAVMRPYALNVAIPLVDLTPETGTTRLFPGSHKHTWSEDKFELPYVARGSCYFVDYRLVHQGTPNVGASERPIIYLAFARPWFTDIENYGNNIRINLAEEDLGAIPKEHRPLFRRLAARGALDRNVKDLFAGLD